MSTHLVASGLFEHKDNPFIVSMQGKNRPKYVRQFRRSHEEPERPTRSERRPNRQIRSEKETFWDYISTYRMPVDAIIGFSDDANKDWQQWYNRLMKPENMTDESRTNEELDLQRLMTLDEFHADDADLLQHWVSQRLSDLRLYDRNR